MQFVYFFYKKRLTYIQYVCYIKCKNIHFVYLKGEHMIEKQKKYHQLE